MSSCWAKPCTHHTVAVLASALAIWGRAIAPAAASPIEPRSTERLVSLSMDSSLVQGPAAPSRPDPHPRGTMRPGDGRFNHSRPALFPPAPRGGVASARRDPRLDDSVAVDHPLTPPIVKPAAIYRRNP